MTNELFNLGVNLSKGLRDDNKDIARVLARKDDPQTSKDAATKIVKSGELSRQEKEVYDKIKEFLKYRKLHKHPLDFTTVEFGS